MGPRQGGGFRTSFAQIAAKMWKNTGGSKKVKFMKNSFSITGQLCYNSTVYHYVQEGVP